jgi:hypothetical protein
MKYYYDDKELLNAYGFGPTVAVGGVVKGAKVAIKVVSIATSVVPAALNLLSDSGKKLKKLASEQKENPGEFSKTSIYKLQNISKDYKFFIIGLRTRVNPTAKVFYTLKFWWVNADRSMKKLVDWAIYGPTEAYYIAIPVNDIIGVYTSKGYRMSSDIFVEYRIDEEVSRWGMKSLERRDATAYFTKEGGEFSRDDFRRIQEGKPSNIGGLQPKPKYEGFFGGIAQAFDNFLKTLGVISIILLILIVLLIFFQARGGLLGSLLRAR